MFKYLIVFLFPFGLTAQVADSLPPMPKTKSTKVKTTSDEQVTDIAWAKEITEDIAHIELVQLRPLCDNGDLIETLMRNDRVEGCYPESVIISTTEYDTNRVYNYKTVASQDHEKIISSCFGKRESNIITMCYTPRHAILFKTNEGKVKGIYEICFECGNALLTNNSSGYISIYGEDYLQLKKVFEEYGYKIK